MPLVEPDNRREKIVLMAAGKHGKTSCWVSIAFWAHKSGDTRKFYVIDTDQAVLDVLNEPKYAGMLAEDGGNIHIYDVLDWTDYEEAGQKILAQAVKGDWIVVDFVSHAWPAVQDDFIRSTAGKSRNKLMAEAGKAGLTGWDMYKNDYNWQAINGNYFEWINGILLRSRAHVFLTAEQEQIPEGSKTTPDAKAHVQEFGAYKAVGQKKLPYQCRSYLRLQRLARGRVLYTLGDRARTELNGESMEPDFFTSYLRNIAGWTMTDPEPTTPPTPPTS